MTNKYFIFILVFIFTLKIVSNVDFFSFVTTTRDISNCRDPLALPKNTGVDIKQSMFIVHWTRFILSLILRCVAFQH